MLPASAKASWSVGDSSTRNAASKPDEIVRTAVEDNEDLVDARRKRLPTRPVHDGAEASSARQHPEGVP